jgi:CAF1 family ribonuclease
MNINKENFWEEAPRLLEAISHAEYIAYDFEMTGINHKDRDAVGPRSTVQEVYRRWRKAAWDFVPIQLGVTLVNFNEAENAYLVKTYTISVTPQTPRFNRASRSLIRDLDRRYGQANDSIEFLEDHDINTAEIYKDGVPYMSREEACSVRHQTRATVSRDRLHWKDARFYDEVRKSVQRWLDLKPSSRVRHYDP